MNTIHYMTGTEDNMRTTTKTGCGVRSEDVGRHASFVFWRGRAVVNCPACLDKIQKVLQLQGALQ